MPDSVKSKPGLIKVFDDCSSEVRGFFEHLPKLLEDYTMDVALSYVFSRLEYGQNMSLYCGVVKRFKANSTTAKDAINTHHMTRDKFKELYRTIYGITLSNSVSVKLREAECVRDRVMHGKTWSANDARNAIAKVLEYAEAVNKQLGKKYEIKPFRQDLRGFGGASKKLNTDQTKFMLKGIGFSI